METGAFGAEGGFEPLKGGRGGGGCGGFGKEWMGWTLQYLGENDWGA